MSICNFCIHVFEVSFFDLILLFDLDRNVFLSFLSLGYQKEMVGVIPKSLFVLKIIDSYNNCNNCFSEF